MGFVLANAAAAHLCVTRPALTADGGRTYPVLRCALLDLHQLMSQLLQKAMSHFRPCRNCVDRLSCPIDRKFSQAFVSTPDSRERCNWYEPCCSHSRFSELVEYRMHGIVCIKQVSNFAQIRVRPVANNSMRPPGGRALSHLRSVLAASSAGAKRRVRRRGNRAHRWPPSPTEGTDLRRRPHRAVMIAYSPGRHTGEQLCVGDRIRNRERVWPG